MYQSAIITTGYQDIMEERRYEKHYYPRSIYTRPKINNDNASYPIIVHMKPLNDRYLNQERSRLQSFPASSTSKSMIYFPRESSRIRERCNCDECIRPSFEERETPYFREIRNPQVSSSKPPSRIPSSSSSLGSSPSPTTVERQKDIELNDESSKEFSTSHVEPNDSEGVTNNTNKTMVTDTDYNSSSNSKCYTCHVCDRTFTWFGNFQKHVLTHGKQSQDHPYFTSGDIPEDEIVIRENNNTFRCALCNKVFTRMSGLRTHIRMHNGQRPYKCSHCNLAFTTNRALKMHTRIHSGERPYKCEQCTKTFTRKDELQAHIYLHKGEKPYKCEKCPAAFVRHGHLQRHMLTHAKEKPYQCKKCPKSFTQYRNLQTHMYKHTGERPYKCRYCGKGFTQHGTVQAHERTHTGSKPYGCKNCDKRFITSSHLRWHVKKHHQDVDPCNNITDYAENVDDENNDIEIDVV